MPETYLWSQHLLTSQRYDSWFWMASRASLLGITAPFGWLWGSFWGGVAILGRYEEMFVPFFDLFCIHLRFALLSTGLVSPVVEIRLSGRGRARDVTEWPAYTSGSQVLDHSVWLPIYGATCLRMCFQVWSP